MWEKYMGLPVLASKNGAAVDQFMGIVHLLMLALFLGWITYFIFVLIRFRRKRNPSANHQGIQSHFPNYLEVGVAVAEGVLLAGFAIPIWVQAVDRFPSEKEATVVRVVAQQFAWNVRYAGPDGVFGRQESKAASSTNPMGLDANDPAGQDDIIILNQLYVPVNQPVVVHLSSMDVIHSFSVKAMRITQDAIPGMSIPVWFTPVKTGQYEINCAQLCGNGHYRMRGYLNVVSAAEFAQWMAQKAKAAAQPQSYE